MTAKQKKSRRRVILCALIIVCGLVFITANLAAQNPDIPKLKLSLDNEQSKTSYLEY